MRIGILAVQGDVSAHAEQLRRLRVDTLEVRTPAQLKVCGGLILPGGESTTQLQFLEEERLLQAIRTFATKGAAIFGTCAGAILLAKGVRNPVQASLGLLDVTIVRNAYGRQMSSEVSLGATSLKEGLTEMVLFALRSSNRSDRRWRCSPATMATPLWCRAETSWPPPSIRNYQTMRPSIDTFFR